MGKKKTNKPQEMTTPEAEVVDESASGTLEPSIEAVSADQDSPEEIEEQEAEPAVEPADALANVQKELTALKDRHLRLVAEFTNYRRRSENELSEAWTRGQADMLRSFIDGLDDLQRVGAWQAESTTVEALVEGVDLVERKFRQALEAAGVELSDPVGEPFDPNIMEAMLGVPTENPEEDQKVQDVFQKGYSFKGHLVRPARVTVFKHE
ncbi:MAG: nucleotide exchange factor GrpE [Gemmatimonadetes bacterium]|nr:nucleotide exchange factor GrpE [Gemmatimonadota bacterium]